MAIRSILSMVRSLSLRVVIVGMLFGCLTDGRGARDTARGTSIESKVG